MQPWRLKQNQRVRKLGTGKHSHLTAFDQPDPALST